MMRLLMLAMLACTWPLAGACRPAPGEGALGRTADEARTAEAPPAPASRIEHFYATSLDAERLYHFFRDTLGLPQVWPFQRWGNFASGGLTLGNVVFELVAEDDPRQRTAFAGIALEPVGTTDSLLPVLADRGIAHERPDSNVNRNEAGELVGWVNTGLPAFAAWGVFFCDYQQRARIALGRSRAADALAAAGGGPLGVRSLEEIVLGATDLGEARRIWRRLGAVPAPGAVGDVFAVGAGPRIRLVRADAAGIREITVAVRSLAVARSALAARGVLGDARDGRVWLGRAAAGGLQVALVER